MIKARGAEVEAGSRAPGPETERQQGAGTRFLFEQMQFFCDADPGEGVLAEDCKVN